MKETIPTERKAMYPFRLDHRIALVTGSLLTIDGGWTAA
jgi:hypothetical protein